MTSRPSLRDFTVAQPRPLPLIVLADTSASMRYEGKIDALNLAVRDLIAACAVASTGRVAFQVAVVAFGGHARLHVPLQSASAVVWEPLQPDGDTPLAAALELVTDLLEDRQVVPSRSYRPSLALMSDGEPTDEWQPAMERLLANRAGKAQRFALQVGPAPGPALAAFSAPHPPVTGPDAESIVEFFDFVTLSVSHRARSINPSEIVPVDDPADLRYF